MSGPALGDRGVQSTSAVTEVDDIAASLSRLWGREVTPGQRKLLSAIAGRGQKAGCDVDHLALVEEAIREISRCDDGLHDAKPGRRIGEDVLDPLEALRQHDEEAHPRKTKPAAEKPLDVDALVALLPAALARRARKMAMAGKSAYLIGESLGLDVWTYEETGLPVLEPSK